MSFRPLRGVMLPEREQGLICFTCLNYDRISSEERRKIRRLCRECGGAYEKALFELLTVDGVSVPDLTEKYGIDLKSLYDLRRRFYVRW